MFKSQCDNDTLPPSHFSKGRPLLASLSSWDLQHGDFPFWFSFQPTRTSKKSTPHETLFHSPQQSPQSPTPPSIPSVVFPNLLSHLGVSLVDGTLRQALRRVTAGPGAGRGHGRAGCGAKGRGARSADPGGGLKGCFSGEWKAIWGLIDFVC